MATGRIKIYPKLEAPPSVKRVTDEIVDHLCGEEACEPARIRMANKLRTDEKAKRIHRAVFHRPSYEDTELYYILWVIMISLLWIIGKGI